MPGCHHELNRTWSRDTFEQEYKGKLEQKYESPMFTVVSEVFKGLMGKKVIAASSSYERWVIYMSSNSCASLISAKQGWAPGFQSTSKSCLWRTLFPQKVLLHVQTPGPEAHWVIRHSPSHLLLACAYTYRMIFPSYLHEGIETFLNVKKVCVTNDMMDSDTMTVPLNTDSRPNQTQKSCGRWSCWVATFALLHSNIRPQGIQCIFAVFLMHVFPVTCLSCCI